MKTFIRILLASALVVSAVPAGAHAQSARASLGARTLPRVRLVQVAEGPTFYFVPADIRAEVSRPAKPAAKRSARGQSRVLSVDRTLVFSGVLGQTVNEVVPIPGTDMIRAGVVQEGSLSQNANRSSQEYRGSSDLPTGALIIFRISRP